MNFQFQQQNMQTSELYYPAERCLWPV